MRVRLPALALLGKLTLSVAGLVPIAAALAQDDAAAPAEQTVTGTMDVGYRWVSNISGNQDVYRSTVNLGEGVRLLGTDLRIADPSKRLFDTLSIRGMGWGGDPQNSAWAEASKANVYRLRFDYRNMAYFNALPSFANPFVTQGVRFSQRAYDTQRRLANFDLELLPGHRVVPYLSYGRSSERGYGVTGYQLDANEYPVANTLRSQQDQYRGGVRFTYSRWSLTLEEGASVFKNDQQVYDATRNPGNRQLRPFLGQTLYLDNLLQSYGIRGNMPYSRAAIAASPFSWLHVQGQFSFAQGRTDTSYNENALGKFANLNPLLFYTSQMDVVTGLAKQPHTSGTFAVEARPFSRLRIIENLVTDRLHTASSLALPFIDNYNQHSIDVLFDVTKFLTLRAGHRYTWGNTTVRTPTILDPGTVQAKLRRPAGVVGASGQWGARVSGNIEFEGGSADDAYYRTSLRDYQRVSARARWQMLSQLSLTWNLNTLDNDYPAAGVNYRFRSRMQGVTLEWLAGDRFTFLADYARTAIDSSILYRVPQTFATDRFPYRDNAHQATAQMMVALPKIAGRPAQLTAGGTLFASSGSRPTHFYRPLAGLIVPVARGVSWTGEWRWNGFNEPFFLFENFRAHQFTTGLRITR